jgi:short-subunit dehydrogenase
MRLLHERRVVVITGASAGVGRATARLFGQAGYAVGLIARGRERLESAVRELHDCGVPALALAVDVADAEQVERCAKRFEEELGPIDVWVNNAMVSVFAPARLIEPAEFKRVTEVTYLGSVYGTLAALRRMLPRDRGTIVLVGSALAYRGIPLQSAYCAAKHAMQGFADSLRAELLHDGSNVQLSMVQLPALNTPQFEWSKSRMPNKARPVPPVYQPEVAARAILWAAHHPRREIRVGLSTSVVIAANKIVPGFGDRYLAKHGYEAQMRPDPDNPARPDNLWGPVAGDFDSHGPFDDEARSHSTQLWFVQHERLLIATALGVAAAALIGRASIRHQRASQRARKRRLPKEHECTSLRP